MGGKMKISVEEARKIGVRIGINWKTSAFDVQQYADGMNVEFDDYYKRLE